jgi:hypothetical protein
VAAVVAAVEGASFVKGRAAIKVAFARCFERAQGRAFRVLRKLAARRRVGL